MNSTQLKEAAAFWDKRDAQGAQMPKELLLQSVASYIISHNTCALATGVGDYIRCTPIEYSYKEGCFWLLSEGGHKFLGIAANPKVSLSIYDSYSNSGSVAGMQIAGVAAFVDIWSREYLDLLSFKKIPMDAVKKLGHPMYLIKITPTRIDYLNSELKKQGYGIRQHINLS